MFDIPVPAYEERPRYTPLPAHTFSTTSLTKWLDYVIKSGIPYIPAEVVAEFNIEHLLRSDEADFPEAQEVYQKLQALNQALEPGFMMRWDSCAGLNVKEAMAYGKAPESYGLEPMEPRTFDILYETPSETIAVLKRPWVQAKMLDGFPIEFRVFVENGEVVAIANYYLQRSMPDTQEYREYAQIALEMTRRIMAEVYLGGIMPAFVRQSTPGERVDCSLDFMVREDGEVMFLEAGPGFGFGAHPCAFLNPDQRTVQELSGLQLESGGTPIPFETLGI